MAWRQADPVSVMENFKPPAAAAEPWPAFVEAIRLLRGRAAVWPAELDLVLRWYAPHLERIHDDAVVRQADLAQFAQIASGYPSRERFLTDLALDPPDATSDQAGVPAQGRRLSHPLHPSIPPRGRNGSRCSFSTSWTVCLPSDLGTGTSAEIEEERRLLYVAMTRAKDQLNLIVPQRFFTPSAETQRRPSRLRLAHAPSFRRQSCGISDAARGRAPARARAGETASLRETVNIGAKLRRMWG